MSTPQPSPEWKEKIRQLTPGELREEIRVEEAILESNKRALAFLEERLESLVEELSVESEKEPSKRYLRRERLIASLEERIRRRQARIENLQRQAEQYLRRALDPYASTVNKLINAEVAASLLRSVRSLRGWQTRDLRRLRSLRGWQTREAPAVQRLLELRTELNRTRAEALSLQRETLLEEAQLEFKRELLPKHVLQRVTIALYLIIEAGEHVYPRDGGYYVYHHPHPRRVRNRVRYPKGRFQSLLETDSFIDPETGEVQTDLDPLKTLLKYIAQEVADEFITEFNLKKLDPEDLTLGVVNIIADKEELGKPPFKLSISRTDEETGREWKKAVNRYIMTTQQYLSIVRDMKEYIEALEALG